MCPVLLNHLPLSGLVRNKIAGEVIVDRQTKEYSRTVHGFDFVDVLQNSGGVLKIVD